METSFDQHYPEPEGRAERSRLIAWLLLGLPLLVYATVWPVRARLDLGEIERHLSGSIWTHMVASLPGFEPQWLIEIGFWAGMVTFMAGALYVVWLALDGAGRIHPHEAAPFDAPPAADDQLDG